MWGEFGEICDMCDSKSARGRRLQTDLARRAGSSEAIPSQFRVPRPRVQQLINLSAPLLFFFSVSRSFPLLLGTHISVILVHRYCHLPFLSRSLYPSVFHFPVRPLLFSVVPLSPRSALSLVPPLPPSSAPPPSSKLTSHSHKARSRSYYHSGTEPIRIRTTALLPHLLSAACPSLPLWIHSCTMDPLMDSTGI
jgi:hypothetical protein